MACRPTGTGRASRIEYVGSGSVDRLRAELAGPIGVDELSATAISGSRWLMRCTSLPGHPDGTVGECWLIAE
jgi:hypothetical protein